MQAAWVLEICTYTYPRTLAATDAEHTDRKLEASRRPLHTHVTQQRESSAALIDLLGLGLGHSSSIQVR